MESSKLYVVKSASVTMNTKNNRGHNIILTYEKVCKKCILSVHRERVNIRKEKLIEQLITKFPIEQLRRLQFFFNN